MKKLAPHHIFGENTVRFTLGDEADLDQIKRNLTFMGYERAAFIESKGQYSIRGGIVDVFPADAEYPYRIEFFDTEVDSVRTFDPVTQRSVENLKSVEIYPAEQMVQEENLFRHAAEKLGKAYDAHAKKLEGARRDRLIQRKNQLLEFIENTANVQLLENYIHYFYEDTEYLWDYMREGGVVMLEDPDRIKEVLDFREKEDKEDFKTMLERGETVPGDYKAFPGRADLENLYRQRGHIFLYAVPETAEGDRPPGRQHSDCFKTGACI